MRIGLILYKTPAKSEQFLRSKIQGLQENGHEVILFAHNEDDFKLCKVVENIKITGPIIIQILRMIFKCTFLIIKSPIISFKYLNLEKSDGTSFKRRWENLYLNSNILDKKLNWIHFCFATTALRRENIAKAINAKMGVSLRGYDINIYPLKNSLCYSLLWEKVDKVHSISYCLLKKAKSLGLKKETSYNIIYPAVNRKIFKNDSLVKIITKSRIEILTVARLHWVKGLDYTIQALSKLKNVDFNYTIVGSGPDYERIILAIKQCNLLKNVKIVDHLPHKDLPPYYKSADLYIQYSIEEGFCNAVVEAQSMGLATIVSDASGLKENIIDNKTGWVVPKRSPQLLAKKINYILSLDQKKIMDIRLNAINRVNEKFDLNYQKEQFNIFFR